MRTGGLALLAVAIAGAMLMLVMSLLQPVRWVQATTDDGTRLACARVDEDTPITLVFTHSMFGGNVAEHYHLRDDGRLERQRMVADNAAAAEYYATDGEIRTTPDGYEVIAPPFATERLAIRVDARGDHRLMIGATTWPLYARLQASTRVTLEGMQTPRIDVPPGCRTGTTSTLATALQHGPFGRMHDPVAPGRAG